MAKGEINTTALDSLTWDTVGQFPQECLIATGVYAIAHMGAGNTGYVTTVSVGADGTLTKVDTLQFEATGVSSAQGRPIDIVKKPGADLVVIAWCSSDSVDGFVCSVDIDSDGNIGSVQDTWEYQPVGGQVPALCHISGDVFAILFRDNGTDGYIWTFSVADNGTITKSAISSWEYDTTEGTNATMIRVSGTIYVVAYNRGYAASQIFTVDIANDGTITKSMIDTLAFPNQTSSNIGDINVLDIGDEYFLIFHTSGDSESGEILTCTIDSSGNISNSWVDTKDIGDNNRFTSAVFNEGLLVLTYDQSIVSDGCYIKTYPVDGSGSIGDEIDSYEFETGPNDSYTRIVRAYAGIYVIFYYGSGVAKAYEVSEIGALHRLFRLLNVYQRIRV